MKLFPENNEPYKLDLKRLYLPYIFKGNCPNCGEEVKYPIAISPIYYAEVNKPFELDISHEIEDENGEPDECEFSISVQLKIDLILEK